jgi:hypothetical protein
MLDVVGLVEQIPQSPITRTYQERNEKAILATTPPNTANLDIRTLLIEYSGVPVL